MMRLPKDFKLATPGLEVYYALKSAQNANSNIVLGN